MQPSFHSFRFPRSVTPIWARYLLFNLPPRCLNEHVSCSLSLFPPTQNYVVFMKLNFHLASFARSVTPIWARYVICKTSLQAMLYSCNPQAGQVFSGTSFSGVGDGGAGVGSTPAGQESQGGMPPRGDGEARVGVKELADITRPDWSSR